MVLISVSGAPVWSHSTYSELIHSAFALGLKSSVPLCELSTAGIKGDFNPVSDTAYYNSIESPHLANIR